MEGHERISKVSISRLGTGMNVPRICAWRILHGVCRVDVHAPSWSVRRVGLLRVVVVNCRDV